MSNSCHHYCQFRHRLNECLTQERSNHLMTGRLKVFIGTVAGCAILVLALWQTLPRWLPGVLSHWLPAGSRLELQGNLHWRQGGGVGGGAFHRARLPAGQRRADAVGLSRGRWQLSSDKVSVDSACLSKLPGGDANSAPLALDQLQRELPSLDLTLNDLTLIPGSAMPASCSFPPALTGNACIIRGRISAPRRSWMKTAADVAKFDHCPAQQRATAAPRRQDNHSAGFGQPADAGRVAGEMQTAYLEKPVLLDMRWQQQQGVLTVSEKATIARWRCCRGKSRRSGSASSRASGVGRTAGSR